MVNGDTTCFACDIDVTQSYVRLAAIKSGLTIDELLNKNINSIRDTFAGYDIGFDLFNVTSISDRTVFTIDFINQLVKSEHVVLKDLEFYFDEHSGKFLLEAFISGHCPKCSAPVKGGVCEICSYYNSSINLVNPHATLNKDAVIIKKSCKVHVFNTKYFTKELIDRLQNINLDNGIRDLISSILLNMNDDYPITLPLEDGINIGSNGLKLNPWIELLGTTYYLKSKAKSNLNCTDFNNLSHTCFIGIDNTFHYVIIHNLIRICMGLSDFPETYFINRFYLLNNSKFATSRNNAIWADEVLQQFDGNLLRIFLALTHPKLEPYDFSMEQLIEFKKNLEANSWIGKLKASVECNIDNTKPLNDFNPSLNAKSLLSIINETEVGDNIFYLLQVLCPSLFKKAMRQIGKVSHIVKENSSSFKREFGVELNRLIALDEYKFGSSVVVVKPGNQTDPHSHDTLDELFYIIEGQASLLLNNHESIVNKGDYAYIPAGMMHTIKPTGSSELKFITIAWYI